MAAPPHSPKRVETATRKERQPASFLPPKKNEGVASLDRTEPPESVYDELARVLIEEAERLERDQQAEHGRLAS